MTQPVNSAVTAARKVALTTCEALLNPGNASAEHSETYGKCCQALDAVLNLSSAEQQETIAANPVVAALVGVHKKVQSLTPGGGGGDSTASAEQQQQIKASTKKPRSKKAAEAAAKEAALQAAILEEEQTLSREARSETFIRECRAGARFNPLPRPGTHSFFGLEQPMQQQQQQHNSGESQTQQSQLAVRRQREDDEDVDENSIVANARRSAALFGLNKPIVSGPVFASNVATVAHLFGEKNFSALLNDVADEVQDEDDEDEDLDLQLDSGVAYQLVREAVLLSLHLVRRSSCYSQCELDLQGMLAEEKKKNENEDAAKKQPQKQQQQQVSPSSQQRHRRSLAFVQSALNSNSCSVCAQQQTVCRVCTQARKCLDLTQMRTFAPRGASGSANVVRSEGEVKLFGVLPVSGSAVRAATESMFV